MTPTLDLELLKSFCLLPGPPGGEEPIRRSVQQALEGLVDDISTDALGNLICFKKGRMPGKVMVAAHLDEISFIITHIDDKGFARIHPLGGFDPKTLTSQRVIAHGKKDLLGVLGTKAIHLMSPEDRNKPAKLSDYFIDFGLPGKEVKEWIRVGDKVTRERDLVWIGNAVSTKSLDNRISVYVLVEALRALGTPAHDLYAVFSVQEEIGLRGATTAARHINPDFGFGLDTTIANDVPNAREHEYITQLGMGAAIKIMDSSVITDARMVRFMEEVAARRQIMTQTEILTAGGTDTGAIQRSGDGAIVGCISLPTRHIHSTVEMCHRDDILQSIALLVGCLEELDQFRMEW